MPDLSIIVPAYQEAGLIATSLDDLADFLQAEAAGSVEVIVVVARGRDGTFNLAQSKASRFEAFEVIDAGPRAGKGRDVMLGMLAARGRYRMFMDADLATPLVHIREVFSLIERGGSVGIAVRPIRSTHKGTRKALSALGNRLVQSTLLPGIEDSQCGFKVFEANVARDLFDGLRTSGWAFDVEVLAMARRRGYPIEFFEVPDWRNPKDNDLAGEWAPWAAVRMAKDIALIRARMRRRLASLPSPRFASGEGSEI